MHNYTLLCEKIKNSSNKRYGTQEKSHQEPAIPFPLNDVPTRPRLRVSDDVSVPREPMRADGLLVHRHFLARLHG